MPYKQRPKCFTWDWLFVLDWKSASATKAMSVESLNSRWSTIIPVRSTGFFRIGFYTCTNCCFYYKICASWTLIHRQHCPALTQRNLTLHPRNQAPRRQTFQAVCQAAHYRVLNPLVVEIESQIALPSFVDDLSNTLSPVCDRTTRITTDQHQRRSRIFWNIIIIYVRLKVVFV